VSARAGSGRSADPAHGSVPRGPGQPARPRRAETEPLLGPAFRDPSRGPARQGTPTAEPQDRDGKGSTASCTGTGLGCRKGGGGRPQWKSLVSGCAYSRIPFYPTTGGEDQVFGACPTSGSATLRPVRRADGGSRRLFHSGCIWRSGSTEPRPFREKESPDKRTTWWTVCEERPRPQGREMDDDGPATGLIISRKTTPKSGRPSVRESPPFRIPRRVSDADRRLWGDFPAGRGRLRRSATQMVRFFCIRKGPQIYFYY